MNKKEALAFYKTQSEKIRAYSTVMSLAYYDHETVAPRGGSEFRSQCFAEVGGDIFMMETDPKFVECVNYLSTCKLNGDQKREIALCKKALDNIINYTKEEVMEFDLACSAAFNAWEKAKQTNDYPLFELHLIKLIELSKKRAKIRDSKKDPYDLYLDDYEDGMNKKTYDRFFELIKKELLPLISKVNAAQDKVDDSFLFRYYPRKKQEEFAAILLEYLHFDPEWGYMGVSEHPFTNGISKNDVRITTAYDEHNITSTIFSIIHETGHAYYEHQVADKYQGSEIHSAISSGMHESQSRFLENYIGRRKSFWVRLYPKLQELFPENLGDVSLDAFVRAINASHSSLIRTDADELTYPIHILIRYEIEKGIFDGSLEPEGLNKVWNAKYKEYLGIEPDSETHGILQDVHWSDASFGYFPTYALGSAIGAQLLHFMEKELDIDGLLEKGRFTAIEKYLAKRLQQYAARYDYNELIRMVCGEDFDPRYYIDYLKSKYQRLYEITD